MKLFLWHVVWVLVPLWLGTLVYRKTGYMLAMKTQNGKPIKFYWQRQRPAEFSKKIWP